MLYETLSDVATAVENHVTEGDIVLAAPESFYDDLYACQGYDVQKRLTGPRSGEIFSRKGKNTRARVQVMIQRFGIADGPARMGRYELIVYTG